MARPRVIDQNDILDAAETVVARDGAAKLTLDAVAIEAGISKASVIYDYKSKQQLIKAVITRCVDKELNRIHTVTAELGSIPNAAMRGLIAAASDAPPDAARTVAVNLGSALAQDNALRSVIEDFYIQIIASVMDTSEDPSRGLLAFLALEGLKALEWHNHYSWSVEDRHRILQDISRLLDTTPERTHQNL